MMSEKVYTNCTNAGPVSVYVIDGKVVRVRPLVADEQDFKPWTINAGATSYTPPKKINLSPYVHAERQRLYSEDRIKYPLIREDFDPNGDRNQENRGKSPYKRISWDEALDVVAGEIRRVKEAYGGAAITGMTSSHHNWGIVGYK
ncbi:molybdopterin-dependent oxidoreductase, partial [Thermodesulfobacteriota bacterium]